MAQKEIEEAEFIVPLTDARQFRNVSLSRYHYKAVCGEIIAAGV